MNTLSKIATRTTNSHNIDTRRLCIITKPVDVLS